MGTAVMTSCSDDNDGPETYLQEYSTGAYVVNSGNMYNKIESSLTAIDYASSTATQKVFKAANGRSLGNTANDGIVYGNKIYLAVDQSNTIEVIDKKTKQSIKQIKTTDLLGKAEGAEPRHIIADGGKVYFTTYGGYVAAVDTTDFALQKKWKVGNYPEGLVFGNGNLYVANSNYAAGGGNISCINLSNDNVETKNIEGVNNPTSIYYASNVLYVLDNPVYGPAPDYAVLSAPFQLAAAEQDGPKALELLDRLLRSLTVPWDLSASPLYPHLPTKDAAEESQRSLIPVLLDGTARDPDCAFLRAEPGWPELLARYQT